MIRGTTPTFTYELPFDCNNLKDIKVFFCQNDKLIFEKNITDCSRDGTKLIIKLTQQETLKLTEKYKLKMQLLAKTLLDEVIASNCIVVDVEELLKDEVI